jgi:superfamily II DNA or RNA helicase/diadenosine tetraphosphate (Ap4A) HIT family hydrolase
VDVNPADCPFCSAAATRIIWANRLTLALWDAYPVSPGHALIVPKRHIESWWDATAEERSGILAAIDSVREAILAQHRPNGFNIGMNEGRDAGQTVPHLHVHVIPRYKGDVTDPRGGIRHVIPSKADYWSDIRQSDGARPDVLVCGGEDPLLPHLVEHLDRSQRAQIAVAFILMSGVEHLGPHLRDLLDRGGTAEILTGDYLDVSDPDALQALLDLREQAGEESRLNLRIFEARERSFHPKAYIFHDTSGPSVAYVGSSNLTKPALTDGIEWNYRVIPARDRAALEEIDAKFRTLWGHSSTRLLTQEWLDRYRDRRKPDLRVVAVDQEPSLPPPEPHAIQHEALAALEATRQEGNSAGLVVLATGLGKTWLSAFDSHRPEFRRVLFVAHREEILAQAMATFRRIRRDAHLGLYTGQERVPEAEVVFASIQTLGRVPHLNLFDRKAFDYVIVDEFHHAAARTYRRLIDYFEPKFLLGLTATPERTDGGDLLALCQENLVYRRDLDAGIELGLLCPFQYFGVPDNVDYSNIPWRSSRFDEEALTEAVATQARAQNALEQFRKRAGARTLAFCCSTRHADFMAQFFSERGVGAAAVHSGSSSAPRATSLERLASGDLEVVFAVDMFNEGVDLPAVDTVLMLRPTESRVLWLQQFGRGLRVTAGKSHLRVIDYIGNHRIFLLKVQTLLQLGAGDFEIARALERLQSGDVALPRGCEVTYDLAAMDILRGLLRVRGTSDSLMLFYENFKGRYGERPTALECFHEGYLPRAARKSHGSWLAFVREQGDLTSELERAWVDGGAFLQALEVTPMTRSYKMLVVLSMLNRDALPGQIEIGDLAAEFARLSRRSTQLQREVGAALEDDAELRQLIERDPVAAWVGAKGTGGVPFFRYEDKKLKFQPEIRDEARGAFQELVREVADWRLAEYMTRDAAAEGQGTFVCKVSHASGQPMLFLPDREQHPEIPLGWTPVVADGSEYEGNFVKVALNVVRKEGSETNVLPGLLHGWFGEDAGRPGTNCQVVFERSERGHEARPLRAPATKNGPEVGRSYRRAEVPGLFGARPKGRIWEAGFVREGDAIVLFVTLKKERPEPQYAYRDRFISAERFQWESQNRTTQQGTVGQSIEHHAERGISVHLFARKQAKIDGQTQPFVYCGRLRFLDWENEKPIKVRWKLESPLSLALSRHFLEEGSGAASQ